MQQQINIFYEYHIHWNYNLADILPDRVISSDGAITKTSPDIPAQQKKTRCNKSYSGKIKAFFAEQLNWLIFFHASSPYKSDKPHTKKQHSCWLRHWGTTSDDIICAKWRICKSKSGKIDFHATKIIT